MSKAEQFRTLIREALKTGKPPCMAKLRKLTADGDKRLQQVMMREIGRTYAREALKKGIIAG